MSQIGPVIKTVDEPDLLPLIRFEPSPAKTPMPVFEPTKQPELVPAKRVR